MKLNKKICNKCKYLVSFNEGASWICCPDSFWPDTREGMRKHLIKGVLPVVPSMGLKERKATDKVPEDCLYKLEHLVMK